METRQVFAAYDREITVEQSWMYCPACGSGLIQLTEGATRRSGASIDLAYAGQL
jgi:Zn finger protein HypA/HybF involved in hydrogenase expression